MADIAPIGISTYARLAHLKQTIANLKKNFLAEKSDLYFFSDGPRKGEEDKVNRVREYLDTVAGFKSVFIVRRKRNGRVFNNRDGIRMLLEKYGKLIFLEEDVVTAPGFLVFMNGALKFFENNENIFSVSGYCPPIKAHKFCSNDFFVLPRFNAWGFGIWKKEFELIEKISKQSFKKLIGNRKEVNEFLEAGDDVLRLLYLESHGVIDALDVKAMFWQFKYKKLTVYPKESLTQNIGHDGTGLHCGKTDKFDVRLWDKKRFEFDGKIAIEPKILESNKNFRSLGVKGKISKLLVHLGLFLYVKQISKALRSR